MRAALVLAPAVLLLSAAASQAAQLSADLRASICGERGTCEPHAVTPAGRDDAGAGLAVAEIALGLADRPDWSMEEGCRSESGDTDGGREYWLLKNGEEPTFLFALCNDGYGAAGLGYDEVTVGENRLTHRQEGGSAWRWSTVTTYSLSPYRVVGERSCSYHNITPWSGVMTDYDPERLQVRSVAWKRGDAQAMEEEDTLGCPDWPDTFSATPSEDTVGAWNISAPMGSGADPLPSTIALGECALPLKSDGSAGFLVYGTPASADAAAEVRVIAERYNTLIVQVYDPTAVKETLAAKGKSWIHAPHVEIWTSTEVSGEDELPAKSYHQVGVGLDGSVNAGVGKPVLPKATRWTSSDDQGRIVTLLRIEWPEEYALLDGVGVVYSQSVNGKQARLVSTTGIVKNKPLYLPGIWTHEPEESGMAGARCELRNGVLTLLR